MVVASGGAHIDDLPLTYLTHLAISLLEGTYCDKKKELIVIRKQMCCS